MACSVKYNKELTFTQDEYKFWFCQKGDIKVNNIRNELANRGLKLSKKPNKYYLENYVFTRVTREMPDKLFKIYKYIVNNLSFKQIFNFVSTQIRYEYGFKMEYIRSTTEIILSESIEAYTKNNWMFFKNSSLLMERLNSLKFSPIVCNCDDRFNFFNCSSCLNYFEFFK